MSRSPQLMTYQASVILWEFVCLITWSVLLDIITDSPLLVRVDLVASSSIIVKLLQQFIFLVMCLFADPLLVGYCGSFHS
jgi:threonine/homoserine/homoserine lactone efflux protein